MSYSEPYDTTNDKNTLPEIRLSPDLKPGRYRIKPTVITTGSYRLKAVSIYINKKEMVRILFNPEPWARTLAGAPILNGQDEIVVEIIQKKREFHEVQGRIRRPVFEYEAKAIENLSIPEKLLNTKLLM